MARKCMCTGTSEHDKAHDGTRWQEELWLDDGTGMEVQFEQIGLGWEGHAMVDDGDDGREIGRERRHNNQQGRRMRSHSRCSISTLTRIHVCKENSGTEAEASEQQKIIDSAGQKT